MRLVGRLITVITYHGELRTADIMLARHLQRWDNIKPTLIQPIVFW